MDCRDWVLNYLGNLFYWLRTSCLDLHQNWYAHSTHANLTKFKHLWEDEWRGENCSAYPKSQGCSCQGASPNVWLEWVGVGWPEYLNFLCSPRVMCRDLTLSLSFLIPMSESPIMIVCFNTEKYTSKSMHVRNVMAVRKLASVLLTKTSCQTAPVHLNNLHSCISLYFSIVSLICCCHLDISRHWQHRQQHHTDGAGQSC